VPVSRSLRAGLATLVVALLLLGAAPAAAHPLGLPAFARITADPAGTVTVRWNAAADDVAALAASLGVDVAPGALLTREQDAALSSSPTLAAALRDGIAVEQDGAPCEAEVAVTSLVEQGAEVRATCPGSGAVTVRIALLHDIDERYRTLGVAGTAEGTERVMFTVAAPVHRLDLDPSAAADVGAAPAPAGDVEAPAAQPFGGSLPFESTFVALIDRSVGLSGVLLGLVVALGVGAAHGLAPGHGKAIAAAYLVGDRGRPRDAVLLGVVVALMHTWSVLALGFALYSATQRPATALLSAWLQAVSGALVAGLGGWLLVRRLRERAAAARDREHAVVGAHGVGDEPDATGAHEHTHGHGHGHTHFPAGASEAHPLSWQGLVALGAAGGLLPSPSALLVLFTALAVGRLAYGLSLIAAFSVGLALTVSAIGLLVLRGRDLLRERARPEGPLPEILRALPLVGAGGVAVLGVVVLIRALGALAS
jgi:nickel/cobalt transporter (NicO) family protein